MRPDEGRSFKVLLLALPWGSSAHSPGPWGETLARSQGPEGNCGRALSFSFLQEGRGKAGLADLGCATQMISAGSGA